MPTGATPWREMRTSNPSMTPQGLVAHAATLVTTNPSATTLNRKPRREAPFITPSRGSAASARRMCSCASSADAPRAASGRRSDSERIARPASSGSAPPATRSMVRAGSRKMRASRTRSVITTAAVTARMARAPRRAGVVPIRATRSATVVASSATASTARRRGARTAESHASRKARRGSGRDARRAIGAEGALTKEESSAYGAGCGGKSGGNPLGTWKVGKPLGTGGNADGNVEGNGGKNGGSGVLDGAALPEGLGAALPDG